MSKQEICPPCNGEGRIETKVFFHPTIADGVVHIERCDECRVFNSDAEAQMSSKTPIN